MSNVDKRARGIFLSAIERGSDQWSEYVDQACLGDASLRDAVEQLLNSHRALGSFHEPTSPALQPTIGSAGSGGMAPVSIDASESIGDDFRLGQRPRRVGRFQIRDLVGHGGMGFVYQAYDEELHRLVAIKFPRIETVGHRAGRERFIREAKLAAQLNHPNLVKIFEIGASDSACYIASQWCEGGNLAEFLQEHPGRQPTRWSAEIIAALARAIAYCHKQRIVHLDIKPANIMLVAGVDGADDIESRAGVVPMLTDFGIARVIEESLTATESSVLIGTPLYMAPEQANCQRDTIGPASDVYSLGVILYELLFGERPYQGESAMMVLDRVRAEETIRIPNVSAVPTDLKTICGRCLEHVPESRYPTADALAEDLERYLRGEPIHARPIRWWHRFGRWAQQPARIFQAGLISLGIQAALLFNFTAVVIAVYQNIAELSVDSHGTALDIAKVAFAVHVPMILLAVLSLRSIRWSVIPGFILSLISIIVLGRVLVLGSSPITFYDDYPAARFLMHLLIFVMMTIQTLVYLIAIPAALRRTPR